MKREGKCNSNVTGRLPQNCSQSLGYSCTAYSRLCEWAFPKGYAVFRKQCPVDEALLCNKYDTASSAAEIVFANLPVL